jgi:hypothetical protein
MNRPECSVDELELIALLDGELTENRARALREHLQPAPEERPGPPAAAGCAHCAARLARLQGLAAQLRGPAPETSDPDFAARFIAEVEGRLPAATPAADGRVTGRGDRRRRAPLALGLAALATAAAAGFLLVPRPSPYTPRGPGAAWHDQVFTALDRVVSAPAGASRRALAAGQRLQPGDGIAVTAHNRNPRLPVYLMVLAVDAANEVHWIVPAWSDPAETPRSVRLPAGSALPDPAGRTPEAPAPGHFRLHTLLTLTPLDVRTVESLLQSGRPLTAHDRHLETLSLDMAPPPPR